MTTAVRLAVLIDADNASASVVDELLREVAKYGIADTVDGFCLVSSDSDFTRLATRLREAGKVVYGPGRAEDAEGLPSGVRSLHLLRSA